MELFKNTWDAFSDIIEDAEQIVKNEKMQNRITDRQHEESNPNNPNIEERRDGKYKALVDFKNYYGQFSITQTFDDKEELSEFINNVYKSIQGCLDSVWALDDPTSKLLDRPNLNNKKTW